MGASLDAPPTAMQVTLESIRRGCPQQAVYAAWLAWHGAHASAADAGEELLALQALLDALAYQLQWALKHLQPSRGHSADQALHSSLSDDQLGDDQLFCDISLVLGLFFCSAGRGMPGTLPCSRTSTDRAGAAGSEDDAHPPAVLSTLEPCPPKRSAASACHVLDSELAQAAEPPPEVCWPPAPPMSPGWKRLVSQALDRCVSW